jgi:hypothetical protein
MAIDVNSLVVDVAQAANGLEIGVAGWPVAANDEAVVLSPWLYFCPREQGSACALAFSGYGRSVHRAEVLL